MKNHQIKAICLLFLFVFALFTLNAQSFTFSNYKDTVYCDTENPIRHCYGYIYNDTPELIEVDFIRLGFQNDGNWISSMCIDTICYYSAVDSVRLNLYPNSVIEFRPGFGLIDDTTTVVGEVQYLIKNVDDSTNEFFFDTHAINVGTTTNTDIHFINENISIYPNPTTDYITIDSKIDIHSVELFSLDGRLQNKWTDLNSINTSNYQEGTYILKINTVDFGVGFRRIVKW